MQYKIPISNLIGFASDNASVMTGSTGGVRTLLKKDNINLFVMGCTCHSLHLCSSAAAKCLPPHLEQLTKNIYAYFAHSTERILELKEIQELCKTKVHKILKTSSTRWLALEDVVNRILEQWQPLQMYFSVSDIEANEEAGRRINSELTLSNQIYFSFLSYVLNITNKINMQFQSEKPQIHTLLKYMKQLYLTIMSNIIKRIFFGRPYFFK